MEAMKRVKIYSAYEKYQAELILSILRNNDIPCYRQGTGAGGYMDIYAGNSLFGEDIYVDERDAKRARQLIEETVGADLGDAESIDEPDEVIEYQGRFAGKYRVGAWILVVLLIGAVIFGFVSNIL